jgi:hypothetical protein
VNEIIIPLQLPKDLSGLACTVKFENNIENTAQQILEGSLLIPVPHPAFSKFENILNGLEPVAVVLEKVSKVCIHQ